MHASVDSKDKDAITEQDKQLFREHLEQHPPLAPRPGPRQQQAPTAAPERQGRRRRRKHSSPAPAGVVFRRPGFQQLKLDRLRRRPCAIDNEIDLHGHKVAEAMQELQRFLQHCRANGQRQLRIVHGQGKNSPDGQPVLKTEVERWLREQPEVQAFWTPPQNEGGAGALYVYLAS